MSKTAAQQQPTRRQMFEDAVAKALDAAATLRDRQAHWTAEVIRERGRLRSLPRGVRAVHERTPVSVVVDARMRTDDAVMIAIDQDRMYTARAVMLGQAELLAEMSAMTAAMRGLGATLNQLATQLARDVTSR